MLLAPYYREYELPWEGDPEATARFNKILRVLLILLLVLGILFPLLPRPAQPTTEDVPQRLARVMIEEQPKPPPPPPPKPQPEEKPKIEPKVTHGDAAAGGPAPEGAREGAEAAEPGQG